MLLFSNKITKCKLNNQSILQKKSVVDKIYQNLSSNRLQI